MPNAPSLFSSLLNLLPSPYLQSSFKALMYLLLRGEGQTRPHHSELKSESALSRFLNHYDWPTRTMIRQARKAVERALLSYADAHRRGPKPLLLVILDLTTLEKRGEFAQLPLSTLNDKQGLHLVILYLVVGKLKFPWAYRVWRGKDQPSPSDLALKLVRTLPPWLNKRFRIRVLADGGLTCESLLEGVVALGYEAVMAIRSDRLAANGLHLHDLKRQGQRVVLKGLAFPVWVSWYKYYLPGGEGAYEWRYVLATYRATAQTIVRLGARRFSIESFFKIMKQEFALPQFGQRTSQGAHRFLFLSLLAYLLSHRVALTLDHPLEWRLLALHTRRLLLPDLVLLASLIECFHLGLPPPSFKTAS